MKNIIFILLSIVFFGSCAEERTQNLDPDFFDITEFVEDHLKENTSYKSATRSITLNGEKEEKVFSDFEMNEILDFLKQFNINRPRWYDKYTIEKKDGIETYSANEEDLNIKKTILSRNNDKITGVEIQYVNNSLISSSEKLITWKLGESIEMNNKSKSLWSKPQEVEMKWTFEK